MNSLFDLAFGLLDKSVEQGSRRVAQLTGRRSFLRGLGAALVGGSFAPMLPYDRTFGAAFAQGSGIATDPGDDEHSCEYWRYCALEGYLCNECGGGVTECPVGSEISSVTWVGTCQNPHDERDYLVSYNDCCGMASCNQASFCFRSEGERPGYRMGLYNDINWCMANMSKGYHCTLAVVVGVADA